MRITGKVVAIASCSALWSHCSPGRRALTVRSFAWFNPWPLLSSFSWILNGTSRPFAAAAAPIMSSSSARATSGSEWTILYHGAGKSFKGRGEFLRLLLEDKGVSYDNSDTNLYGPTGIFDVFRGSTAQAILDQHCSDTLPFPVLYPPAIWHRPRNGEDEPVLIHQTAACMMYIGEQLGYAPTSSAERARANAILLTTMDYIGEGRASFHPVKNHMSYKDQKEEGDKVSKEFTQDRMLKYLYYFDKVIQSASAAVAAGSTTSSPTPSPVGGGSHVTYADFALFHVLDATAHQFNSDFYDMAWDACLKIC